MDDVSRETKHRPSTTLAAQKNEMGREYGMRRGFYPKQIQSRRMTRADADLKLVTMQDAYHAFKWLERHMDRLRAIAEETGDPLPWVD